MYVIYCCCTKTEYGSNILSYLSVSLFFLASSVKVALFFFRWCLHKNDTIGSLGKNVSFTHIQGMYQTYFHNFKNQINFLYLKKDAELF